MDIHEFQAKSLLKKYGVSLPEFEVVSSIQNLEKVLEEKGWQSVVLKAQIHAGARGKGGGIKFATGKREILNAAQNLIGKKIVTPQTGPEGLFVHHLLVSPSVNIVRESYLGITIDCKRAQSVLIASAVGGVEIEKLAKEQPQNILVLPIPPQGFFYSYHLIRIAKFMKWKGKIAEQGTRMINALIKAFIDNDALLLEVNPLVETPEDHLFALDVKLTVDDNALFRQPQIKKLFDPTQVSIHEARARQMGLAYVSLDGNIGCMVNGAGLAMSTMDLIQRFGGKPANFLDIGGSASKETIAEGFKVILSDPKVKAILINIFGGIMSCETLALGILDVAKDLSLDVPLIVRLEGTNVERGRQLFKGSGLNILIIDNLLEAAKQAVQLAQQTKNSL